MNAGPRHTIDLHTHSTSSDGTNSPSELVGDAAAKKVELLALTDHDTVAGVPEAAAACAAVGIRFIAGVEISTNADEHMHMLGLGIDHTNKKLADFLAHYRANRTTRIKKMVAKLQAFGLEVSFEELPVTKGGSVGRAHLADLLKAKGYADTRQDAFRKYLIPGRPGYAEHQGPSITEAMDIIKEAGGRPVLAHPGVISSKWNFPAWTQSGLCGVEAFYSSHSESMTRILLDMADKYKLIITAGSDYHGPRSGREKNIGMSVSHENFLRIQKGLGL